MANRSCSHNIYLQRYITPQETQQAATKTCNKKIFTLMLRLPFRSLRRIYDQPQPTNKPSSCIYGETFWPAVLF